MQRLEVSGVPVLYIGRTVLKVKHTRTWVVRLTHELIVRCWRTLNCLTATFFEAWVEWQMPRDELSSLNAPKQWICSARYHGNGIRG